MITDFLSGINVWLAVVLVDGAIGLIIYAFFCAVSIANYEIDVFKGVINPEEYEEEEDFPNGENADWY